MAQKKKKNNYKKTPQAVFQPAEKAPEKDGRKLIIRIGMLVLAFLLALSAIAPIFM